MALFRRGPVHLKRTLSSLRHRDFRLLFFGTSLSHVGDFVLVMAQRWLVWTMTSSPFLLGVSGFCQALPRLLLGAVGGALVDRIDRRRLLGRQCGELSRHHRDPTYYDFPAGQVKK